MFRDTTVPLICEIYFIYLSKSIFCIYPENYMVLETVVSFFSPLTLKTNIVNCFS